MSNYYKKNMRCARDNKPQILQIVSKAKVLSSLDARVTIVPSALQAEQARYILDQEYVAKKPSIDKHVFGFVFCLDYYLMRELIKKYSWYTKLFFVFPSADYFNTLLHHYDFTPLIKSPNFMPLAFNEESDFAVNIKFNLTTFDFYNNGLQFFEYQPYRILFPENVKFANKIIREVSYFCAANINTTLTWGNDVIINNIKNLSRFIQYPDASILGKIWEGKPIICVAAGPSLQKNIAFLKTIQNDVFIIAVSAALKPLVAAGVKPDMITMPDMLEEGKLYLEGQDLSDIYTVKDLSCFHGIVREHPSKYIFSTSAMQSTALVHSIISQLGLVVDPEFIFTGTMTVANLSILVAHAMGANKIILLGQDLAYTDRTHVEGSRFSHPTTITEQDGQKTIEFKTFDDEANTVLKLIPVKGFWGDTAWTTDQFLTYREFMEHLFKRHQLDVVNATEGGSYIEGAEHITLEEAYTRYIKPAPIQSKDLNIPATRQDYDFSRLPDYIHNIESLVSGYVLLRDDAITMVGFVERDEGEKSMKKAREFDRLVVEFLSKYSQEVDALGNIGHAGQVLFRRIMNANTSHYSDEDKMADSRNKVVLLSSAVIQTSGMLIRELELLCTELREIYEQKKET